jgi:hypothetical protein
MCTPSQADAPTPNDEMRMGKAEAVAAVDELQATDRHHIASLEKTWPYDALSAPRHSQMRGRVPQRDVGCAGVLSRNGARRKCGQNHGQREQARGHEPDATFGPVAVERLLLKRLWIPLLAGVSALALAACGSSSHGSATSLLKETFGGNHTVNSGNLNFSVTVDPTGSSTLTTPITLSFGGPFQSQGQGKLPKSNFNVSISADGKSGTLGILSTGTAGFVTLQGVSYQLPASTFQKLESSFAGLTSSSGGGSGSGTLSRLGIHPLSWLTNPSVVGNETVGGTQTTHIRAGVNVAALLVDINTLLQKASSLGASSAASGITTISPTSRQKIASEVKNPTFDVWTGTSDKTIRRLAISLTVPVTGQISSLLGGMRTAQIGLSMQYSNLNQPQTITAPTTIRPFSEFQAKLQSLLSTVQGLGAGSTSGGTSSPSSGGSSSQVQSYSQCILNAHNDIAKMQRCASLINGG